MNTLQLDILAKSILELHIETKIPIEQIIEAFVPTPQTLSSSKKSISKFLNINLTQFGSYINPTAHYKQARVLLLTSQATLLPGNRFQWNISLTPNSTSTQHIPLNSPPTYIYQIQTLVTSITINLDNLKMRTSEGDIITNSNTWGQSKYNYNNCFTILLEEYQAQSFVARSGKKFHFTYSPFFMNRTNNIVYVEFVSHLKGQGYYKFTKPILFSTTITITVGDPFNTMDSDIIQHMSIPLIFYYM